jgi:hypothetical protein
MCDKVDDMDVYGRQAPTPDTVRVLGDGDPTPRSGGGVEPVAPET